MKIHLSYPFSRKTFDLFNIIYSDYPELTVFFTKGNSFVINLLIKLCYPSAQLILKSDLFKNSKDFILFPQEVDQVQEINHIKQNFTYCFPDSSTINICNDKSMFYNFCEENSLLHPRVFRNGQKFETPKNIILKPNKGSGSRGINIKLGFKGVLSIPFGYLAQEYIGNSNEIFGFFAFCHKGDVLNSYQHIRIKTYPQRGGVSVYSKIAKNIEIYKAASIIIKKLNYTGLIMIEFKEFEGNLYAIEVNPRLWGSLLLSLNQDESLLDSYLNSIGLKVKSRNKNKKESIIWVMPYVFIYPTVVKYIKNSYLINYSKSNFFRSLLFTISMLSYKLFKIENSSI